MFGNYLKTAFRNLLRNKFISGVNMLGLTIGMTVCLLILCYVMYERSYDRFHRNSERIYRLRYERYSVDGESVRFASCCPPAALRIRTKCPEVEKVGRIFRYRAGVSHGENKFFEERMYFADAEFIEVLQFPFIAGDPVKDLLQPNNAFLSVSTAKKYFGDRDPLGQTISVDKKIDYRVAGIFADIPRNSHLKFDILLSYPTIYNIYGKDIDESWGDSGMFTYLRLKEQVDPDAFRKKLPGIIDPQFLEELKQYKLTMELPLQPLTDIHLTSHFQQEYESNGDRDTVNYLSVIAVFIILIAWVNYINLSTARALTRAKEVGLRKVVGASRPQLMIQFFLETLLINIAAILLTFGLVKFLFPFLSDITGISPEYSLWTESWFWFAVAGMFFGGVGLSGLYPVIVLTSFQPGTMLRGKLENAAKGINLRKILVVFQFMMSIILITGTVAVFRQLSFIKNQDLGVNIEQTLVVRAPRVRDAAFGKKLTTFKDILLKDPGINKFCVGSDVPGKQGWWDAGGIARVGSDESKNYQIIGIDYDYADLFQLKFAAGRNFSGEFPTDSSALILNETGITWMGFSGSEAAIGQQVDYWGKIYTIIGVLKDYHQQSLKQAFEPHIFRFMPHGRDVRGLFAMKVNPQEVQTTIETVRKLYQEFFPDNPFEYFFLDEYYNRQYRADELFGKVFGMFSILAIIVTGFGILGLSSFMIMQRMKEIGVRKVLGANVSQISYLLSKDFLFLILISFIAAFPVSFFGVKYWLRSFAVRMDMSVILFLLPLGIVVIMTMLTISIHIVKAARMNPIKTLRYE